MPLGAEINEVEFYEALQLIEAYREQEKIKYMKFIRKSFILSFGSLNFLKAIDEAQQYGIVNETEVALLEKAVELMKFETGIRTFEVFDDFNKIMKITEIETIGKPMRKVLLKVYRLTFKRDKSSITNKELFNMNWNT